MLSSILRSKHRLRLPIHALRHFRSSSKRLDSTAHAPSQAEEPQPQPPASSSSSSSRRQSPPHVDVRPHVARAPKSKKRQSNKLRITNLNAQTSEKAILRTFRKLGNVTEVVIERDEEGNSRGEAYVTYESVEDAAYALSVHEKGEGLTFYGDRVELEYDRPRAAAPEPEPEARRESKPSGPKGIRSIDPECNLFIKNLPEQADEHDLSVIFKKFGALKRVSIPRDSENKSNGIANAIYYTHDDAALALQAILLAPILLYDKRLHVSFSKAFTGKPTLRSTFVVRDVPSDATEESLEETFENYGPVKSVFVVRDSKDKPKNIALITYSTIYDFQLARIRFKKNPPTLSGHPLQISEHTLTPKRTQRNQRKQPAAAPKPKPLGPTPGSSRQRRSDTLYLERVPLEAEEKDLREVFGWFGALRRVVILRDENNISLGRAYLTFRLLEGAVEALKHHRAHQFTILNSHIGVEFVPRVPGAGLPPRPWPPRSNENQGKVEPEHFVPGLPNSELPAWSATDIVKYYRKNTLFLERVPLEVGEKDLKELFDPFGELKRIVVLRDENDTSTGRAYVIYRTLEGAREAMKRHREVPFTIRGIRVGVECPRSAGEWLKSVDKQRAVEVSKRVGEVSKTVPSNSNSTSPSTPRPSPKWTPEEISKLRLPHTLYLDQVPLEVNERELKGIFEGFGKLMRIVLERNEEDDTPTGRAYIRYCVPEGAQEAMKRHRVAPFVVRGIRVGVLCDSENAEVVEGGVTEESVDRERVDAQEGASEQAEAADIPTNAGER